MDFHVHKDEIKHENFYCIPAMTLEDAIEESEKEGFKLLYDNNMDNKAMGFINQNNDAWIEFIEIKKGDYVRFRHGEKEDGMDKCKAEVNTDFALKEVFGNIFDFAEDFDAICITTNGMVKSDGKAVMGAGVAKTCRDTLAGSDKNLAEKIKLNGNAVQFFEQFGNAKVIAFPTKNNWRDNSDINLIVKSAQELMNLIELHDLKSVLLPRPGCTNGGLNWKDVKKELVRILDHRVVIISKPNILECSSKGDKRFSAFYAKVKLFGKYDSIENHYQLSKRFGDEVPKTWKDAKGKKPTHLHINGKDFDVQFTEAWYDLLWVTYLHNHQNLVDHAKKFDEFNDMFKSKESVVCQADSIRKFISLGRQSILEEHEDFIKEARK